MTTVRRNAISVLCGQLLERNETSGESQVLKPVRGDFSPDTLENARTSIFWTFESLDAIVALVEWHVLHLALDYFNVAAK